MRLQPLGHLSTLNRAQRQKPPVRSNRFALGTNYQSSRRIQIRETWGGLEIRGGVALRLLLFCCRPHEAGLLIPRRLLACPTTEMLPFRVYPRAYAAGSVGEWAMVRWKAGPLSRAEAPASAQ